MAWLGDFGRTPAVNKDPGRDHWPACYSAVLAGGGVRGGQAVGASDALGAYPKSRPSALLIQPGEVNHTRQGGGVVGTQLPVETLRRLPQQRLGFRILATGQVHPGEVAHASKSVRKE